MSKNDLRSQMRGKGLSGVRFDGRRPGWSSHKATDAASKAGRTPRYEVHPHPIVWDLLGEAWVCKEACGYSRPARPGEVVPRATAASSWVRL